MRPKMRLDSQDDAAAGLSAAVPSATLSDLIARVYDVALAGGGMPQLLEGLSRGFAPFGITIAVRAAPATANVSEDEAESVAGIASDNGQGERDAVAEGTHEDRFTAASSEPEDGFARSVVLGYFHGPTPDRRAKLVLEYVADDPVGGDAQVALADIAPHVLRAIQVQRNLIGRRVQSAASARLLDLVPMGIVLVNASGRVLQANRRGQEILDLRDGLSTDRVGVCTTLPKETARLRRIITRVATAGEGTEGTPVGVMRVDRPSMQPAWMLLAVPVLFGQAEQGLAALAALFVADGQETPEMTGEVLERLLDLTPAEARLLVALVNGHSLEEAAKMFSVSKNTLRNQLNQIFRKTEASKQSELMRLVLTSPATALLSAARPPPETEDQAGDGS